MKKVLILCLVLAMASMASAGMVGLEASKTQEVKPSDIIVISVFSSGFAQPGDLPTDIGRFKASITGSAGAASNGKLNTRFNDLGEPGTITGNFAITGIDGSVATGSTAPNNEVLYTFELHIPELPYSSIITITLSDVVLTNAFNGSLDPTVCGPIELHVTPEPMTIALLGLGGLFLRRRK